MVGVGRPTKSAATAGTRSIVGSAIVNGRHAPKATRPHLPCWGGRLEGVENQMVLAEGMCGPERGCRPARRRIGVPAGSGQCGTEGVEQFSGALLADHRGVAAVEEHALFREGERGA